VPLTDATLEVLHDHYKESFTFIRGREGQRDRLFLWLLLFYAILILEVGFPANAHGVLGSVRIGENSLNLQLIPLQLLLDASWVVVAACVLKYCQLSTGIERQYDYLHMLEDHLSVALGDDQLYRREGRAYLSSYPWLLTWAWLCYIALFPAALLVATTYLYAVEVAQLRYGWASEAFDGMFVVSILVSVGLYRVLPGGRRVVQSLRRRRRLWPGG
jgi:hypothetical protein